MKNNVHSHAATRADFFWGYAAQFLNMGAGVILLPVILHYMSREDVGLWFVFLALVSLAQLLEFGFQPTISRNTSYVYAGAQSLLKTGVPTIVDASAHLNHHLLAELVAAARFVYRIVAGSAAALLLVAGSFYIATLLTPSQSLTSTLIAWAMFALGYIINFYYGYFTGIILGRGDVAEANIVVVVTRGTLVILGAAAVCAGFGLIGLGAASMIACIIGRSLARAYFYTSKRPEMTLVRNIAIRGHALVRTLWHNAARFGAVQVGGFFIQRANILIASSFLGLAVAASYSMTLTIMFAISTVSMVICNVQLPYMNRLQAEGNRDKLRTIYGATLVSAWGLYIIGLVLFLLLGPALLTLISSKTPLLPFWALCFLGVILLLEMNHSIAASYITTINKIPFVAAALISGVAIVLFSIMTVKYLGGWGLIVSQGLVQLAYNNWKWPYDVSVHLKASPVRLAGIGLHTLWRVFVTQKKRAEIHSI